MTPLSRWSSPDYTMSVGRCVLLVLLISIFLCSAFVAPPDDTSAITAGRVVPEELPFLESANGVNRHFGHLDDMINGVALEGGELILNMQTASAIAEGNRDLPSELTSGAIARIRFLVTQGVQGPAGEALADLLLDYHAYDKALAKANNTPGGADKAKGVAIERELQIQYFGEVTAGELFGQMNLLRQTLMNRQQSKKAGKDE